MMKRQMPPGRKSISCIVVVKPFGPHHCTMCFGSDHAFQTSSRGASKTREATISRAAASVATAMFLLLTLELRQVFIQTIESVFPEEAIVLDPFGDFFHRA